MSEYRDRTPEELQDVVQRLRAERPEASDLELDRAMVGVLTRAAREPAGATRGWRPRAVSTMAAIGRLAAGVAGLGAGSGGIPSLSFSNSDSANSQYCPPTSQSGGKPKDKDEKGGNKCGQPKNKKDD